MSTPTRVAQSTPALANLPVPCPNLLRDPSKLLRDPSPQANCFDLAAPVAVHQNCPRLPGNLRLPHSLCPNPCPSPQPRNLALYPSLSLLLPPHTLATHPRVLSERRRHLPRPRLLPRKSPPPRSCTISTATARMSCPSEPAKLCRSSLRKEMVRFHSNP
jgi:hypothetical protein